MSTKLTRLTRANTLALAMAVEPHCPGLVVGATTAEFPGTATESLTVVRDVMAHYRGSRVGGNYQALHAVVRKLTAAERQS
jgi:hypothetical protein